MKIALVQMPLIWEDVSGNTEYFKERLYEIENDTDLVILPEMFTSGFTMHPERVFLTMDSSFITVLMQVCIAKKFALTGSMVIKEANKFYNRLFFIKPSGEFFTYDKRHLFSLAGEEKVYHSGKERKIIEYKGWFICPLVCYDLRFPAFSRNTDAVYDLLIYVANWPDQRIYAWDTLLKARAIENMSYTIGVNRCGTDENNNVYSGHSQVVDYMGQPVISPVKGEQIIYSVLEKETQDEVRQKFGFLRDADSVFIA